MYIYAMDSFIYMKPGVIANDGVQLFRDLGPSEFCKKFSRELDGRILFHIPPYEYLFKTDLPKFIELGNSNEENPYHLFFYMLARFYFVDHGHNNIYYYYPNAKNCYISEAALSALPARFHRSLTKSGEDTIREYVQLPGLHWGTNNINEIWIYAYVRDLFTPLWSPFIKEAKKYTYISRSKGQLGTRKILNESEFTDDLKRLGFCIYNMEDLTFEEQIRLFRTSSIITGAHGAGLAFLIFCEPGTKVLEIWKDEYENLHYKDISSRCNLDYNRFTEVEFYDSQDHSMRVKKNEYLDALKNLTNK